MLTHQIPLDAAFGSLRSSLAGLSSAEAAATRLEFGPNRIERLPKPPLVLRFVGQFTFGKSARLAGGHRRRGIASGYRRPLSAAAV